jgi:hypothetical protein
MLLLLMCSRKDIGPDFGIAVVVVVVVVQE